MTREEAVAACLEAFRRESPKPDHSKYGGCRKPRQCFELAVDTLLPDLESEAK